MPPLLPSAVRDAAFGDPASATELTLAGRGVTSLPPGCLDAATSLRSLCLHGNALPSLAGPDWGGPWGENLVSLGAAGNRLRSLAGLIDCPGPRGEEGAETKPDRPGSPGPGAAEAASSATDAGAAHGDAPSSSPPTPLPPPSLPPLPLRHLRIERNPLKTLDGVGARLPHLVELLAHGGAFSGPSAVAAVAELRELRSLSLRPGCPGLEAIDEMAWRGWVVKRCAASLTRLDGREVDDADRAAAAEAPDDPAPSLPAAAPRARGGKGGKGLGVGAEPEPVSRDPVPRGRLLASRVPRASVVAVAAAEGTTTPRRRPPPPGAWYPGGARDSSLSGDPVPASARSPRPVLGGGGSLKGPLRTEARPRRAMPRPPPRPSAARAAAEAAGGTAGVSSIVRTKAPTTARRGHPRALRAATGPAFEPGAMFRGGGGEGEEGSPELAGALASMSAAVSSLGGTAQVGLAIPTIKTPPLPRRKKPPLTVAAAAAPVDSAAVDAAATASPCPAAAAAAASAAAVAAANAAAEAANVAGVLAEKMARLRAMDEAAGVRAKGAARDDSWRDELQGASSLATTREGRD